jgi:hypothetical protein
MTNLRGEDVAAHTAAKVGQEPDRAAGQDDSCRDRRHSEAGAALERAPET